MPLILTVILTIIQDFVKTRKMIFKIIWVPAQSYISNSQLSIKITQCAYFTAKIKIIVPAYCIEYPFNSVGQQILTSKEVGGGGGGGGDV